MMTTAPAAVIVEPAVRAAHAVRAVIMGVLAAVLIAVVSLHAFGLFYGVENRPFNGLPAAPASAPAAERLVAQQEAIGLRCRTEPAFTDQVVFQYATGSPTAGLLTFDEAVAAQKSGTGSIQRYCL